MSFYAKLMANEGFGAFRAMVSKWAGFPALATAWQGMSGAFNEMSKLGGYMAQRTGSVPIGGKAATTAAAGRGWAQGRRFLGEWARGMDITGMSPLRQRALGAGRVGAVAAGGIGAADFLNPWGFGWND